MNITNRKQWNAFIKDMQQYEVKVFDTETNGLHPYRGDHMISISVFFPECGRSYNAAFLHGEGKVDVNWTNKYPEGTPFDSLTWQGRTKKQLYLGYWFEQFKKTVEPEYFGNLPIAWLDELKAVWGKGLYIGHNTRFDAHVLYAAGFPDMQNVHDTMIALHIVNEDWKHIQLNAPYTYTKSNAPSPDLVGMWAKDSDGNLLKKVQYANRRLKWQAAFHGFAGATDGETELFLARRAFESVLVDFIMDNIHDPINDSLLLAKIKKGTATEADWIKQREKIAAKVEIDDKANMWMLPSGDVSNYAELDVRLTWDLYQWCERVINQWDNWELFLNQSLIHHHVAWDMERTGFKLDFEEAQRQLDELRPRIAEVEAILVRVAMEHGIEELNPYSPQQLLRFLNCGVLGVDYGTDLFPDWVDVGLTLELKTYPGVYLSSGELEDEEDEALQSTGKKELERVEDHPVVRLLKELRKMRKSADTYLSRWISAADANGIVRFSINDDGTVSGRASSSGDAGNGQNIPDRGGYQIKRAVVSPFDPANWLLFAIDYGQLELRIAAWIAEGLRGLDSNMTMTNLFLSGEDMHSYVRDMIGVQSILFGDMDEKLICYRLGYNDYQIEKNGGAKKIVGKYCRQAAKTMNFGLLYSGGAQMLSNLLKLDIEVSKVLVHRWRSLFPAFPQAQQLITEEVQVRRLQPNGAGYGQYYTQPISGRHRKIHLYNTHAVYMEGGVALSYNPREAAARKVWNNTVQGLGGYICMASGYNIYQELGRENVRFFANIHDALEGYIHRDHLYLLPEIERVMVDWDIVPGLTVDTEVSRDGTWQSMTGIKDMDTLIKSRGYDGI